jgi:hypothetical protein
MACYPVPQATIHGEDLGTGVPPCTRYPVHRSKQSELTRRKLRRSAHRSVRELEADLRKWTSEWNKNPKPFIWTKTADETFETSLVAAGKCRSLPRLNRKSSASGSWTSCRVAARNRGTTA